MICQILLDKILYDTDRAIDLYTLGSDPDGAGEPEWRAAAFAALIIQFLNDNPARRQQRLPRRRMLPPSQRAHRHPRADPRPAGIRKARWRRGAVILAGSGRRRLIAT